MRSEEMSATAPVPLSWFLRSAITGILAENSNEQTKTNDGLEQRKVAQALRASSAAGASEGLLLGCRC